MTWEEKRQKEREEMRRSGYRYLFYALISFLFTVGLTYLIAWLSWNWVSYYLTLTQVWLSILTFMSGIFTIASVILAVDKLEN